MAMSQPNVLFFFSDQQRWDTCGCYGQPLPVTPHLDQMSAEGVLFENAFTCQPVCGPARATLQTGQWPTSVGCPTNHCMPPADSFALAPAFKQAGYETGYIGKWHLASFGPADGADDFRTKPVPPERRGGYDYWLASDALEFTSHGHDGHMFDGEGNRVEFPEGRYRADAQTDWVLDYLRTRDIATGIADAKPFFLMASYIEPHHQNDNSCYEGPRGSKEQWANYDVPGDLVGTEGDWRENYSDYLGCCNSLDENLGRIFRTLTELGLADNTIVIYTSDHGSHFCTRNSEYKRSCHDGCTHIPMLAWGGPFARGGQRVEELVSLIDIPPTLLAGAGVAVPEQFAGRPLTEALDGAPADWPGEQLIQISESQCGRAIRTDRWTYSVYDPDQPYHALNSQRYVEQYLYDNEADPHQKNNLILDPAFADIRSDLRARLIKCIQNAEGMTPEIGHP
jgi:arylsulfatase A-like enzyme